MPKNAALYLSDPSMIGSRLFDRFETIQSYEGINDDNDSASAFILTLPWGDIRMNIMEGDKLRVHMNGFEGYAQHVIDDRDRLIYTVRTYKPTSSVGYANLLAKLKSAWLLGG